MLSKFRNFSSLILLTLAAFLVFGCGDSNDDFVFTGNNSGSTGNGSQLVFRFQRPVTAQTTVPADTTTIRFDLYSTDAPTSAALLSSETRLYADLIVLENVPTETRSVNVTLLNQDGLPTGTYTKVVSVPAGSRIEVSLEGVPVTPPSFTELGLTPNPINVYITSGDADSNTVQLSVGATINGSVFPAPFEDVTVTVEHPNVLQILDSGLLLVQRNILALESPISGVGVRSNTTVTASYTLNQVTRQTVAPVNIHYFSSEIGAFIGLLFGTGEIPVPSGEENVFDGTFGDYFYIGPDGIAVLIEQEEVTLALETSSSQITLNSETGELSIPAETPVGTKFSLVSTWVDNRENGSNHTYVERLNFVVVENIPG